MSNDSAKVQVNIKSGEGFDATLVNVYAETPGELDALLNGVIAAAPLIAAAKGAVQVAHGIEVKSAQPQQAPPQQQEGWQNQSATPPPFVQGNGQEGGRTQYSQPDNSQPPTCMHGPKKWVPGGVSKKTGNPYNGFWACSAPQGQQCKN